MTTFSSSKRNQKKILDVYHVLKTHKKMVQLLRKDGFPTREPSIRRFLYPLIHQNEKNSSISVSSTDLPSSVVAMEVLRRESNSRLLHHAESQQKIKRDQVDRRGDDKIKDRLGIQDEDLVINSLESMGDIERGFVSKVYDNNFEITVVPDVTHTNRSLFNKLNNMRDMLLSVRSVLTEIRDVLGKAQKKDDVTSFINVSVQTLKHISLSHKGNDVWLQRTISTLPYIANLIEKGKKSKKGIPQIFADELLIQSSRSFKGGVQSRNEKPRVYIPGIGDVPVKDVPGLYSKNKYSSIYLFLRKQSSITLCITSNGELAFRVKGLITSIKKVDSTDISDDVGKLYTSLSLTPERMTMCQRYVAYKCELSPDTKRFFKSLVLLNKLFTLLDEESREIVGNFRLKDEDTHQALLNLLEKLIIEGKLHISDHELILESLTSHNNWTMVCQSHKKNYHELWCDSLSLVNQSCDTVCIIPFAPTLLGTMKPSRPFGNEQVFSFNFRGCKEHVICGRTQYNTSRFDPDKRIKYNVIVLAKDLEGVVASSSFEVYIVVTQ